MGQKTERQAINNLLLDSGSHAKVSKMGKNLKEKIIKLCSESLLQPFWNTTSLISKFKIALFYYTQAVIEFVRL